MTQYDYEIDDVLAHFPKKDSEDMLKFMNEVVFKESRYIFTTRGSGKQYGYCTYCGKKYETDGIKHNSNEECPECHCLCTIKASGYGRSKMIDERYFVWYEKSIINPEAIIARGVYAVRDWRGKEYWNVETKHKDAALYVFEPGGAMQIKRSVAYPDWEGEEDTFHIWNWERTNKIYPGENGGHLKSIPKFCSISSIEDAVKDTSFSWSGWEAFTDTDFVEFFGLYSKWPCIEYLMKLGFINLVKNKLEGAKTYSAINWRGKSLESVLRLTKNDIYELKETNTILTFLGMKIFQLSWEEEDPVSIVEACRIANIYGGYYFDDIKRMNKYGSIKKATRYLEKQYKKNISNYYSETTPFTDWKDYLSDCRELGMNLEDENVIFPGNLYNAHQNITKQIKIREDRKLREKFRKRYKELQKYSFEYQGLLIRPAKNQNEMIKEGKVLDHCVGTYGKRHAKGETGIFLLRKVTKPSEPYYTVEIRDAKVIQVRGKHNSAPNEEVSEFMKVFKSEKLGKKKNKIPA